MKPTMTRPIAYVGALSAAAVSLLLFVAPSVAQSVCVSCEGPEALYSCSSAPGSPAAQAGLGGRRLQFSCIQDIARQYKHASCRVRREQLGSCTGLVHMLNEAAVNPALAPELASPPAPNALAAPSILPPETAGAPAARKVSPVQSSAPSRSPNVRQETPEPKTVVELAKQTAKTTEKEIGRSAENVSRAARSTWRCIATLFSEC